MQIKKLHIENFGGLSNVDLDLTPGINTICEDNGYGKSTISAFIKAMLYGMPAYTSATKAFTDRMHYFPFSEGIFGGYIEIDYQGKEYRIERTFGEKSDKGDKLTVYCNATQTDELGKIPGVKLFGINKESFENLLCVNSSSTKVSADSDINKKLNNYVDNVSEDFNITDVLKKIDQAAKGCAARVKTLNDTIKQTENSILNLNNDKESLSRKQELFRQAEKQKLEAVVVLNSASSRAALLEKWKTYDYHIAERDKTEKALKELDSRYHGPLPSKDQLKQIIQEFESIRTDKGSLKAFEFSSEDKAELDALKKRYKSGIPDEYELEQIAASIAELRDKQKRLDEISDVSVPDEQQALETHFHGEKVSEQFVSDLEADLADYEAKRKELESVNPYLIEYTKREPIKVPVSKAPYIALLVLAAVLITAGVLLISPVFAAGLICLIAGGLLILADMFAYLVKSMNSYQMPENEPQQAPNPEYDSIKAETEALRNKLLMKLANYRYNGDDPVKLFYEFRTGAASYEKMLDDSAASKSDAAQLTEQIAGIQTELDGFFGKYGIASGDHGKALDSVKSDITKYNTLEKRSASCAQKTEQLEKSIAGSQRAISEFAASFSLAQDFSPEQLQADISERERLLKELKDRTAAAERFKSENSLSERPKNEQIDIEQLENDKNDKLLQYEQLRSQISLLEDEVSELDDMKLSLAEYKEEKKELTKKEKFYKCLANEILSADQRLKDKYVKPIRDSFCGYAKLIEDTIGQKVSMDKDYKVSFDIRGKLRSYMHLSSGNLAVCALCFRLALIDNMFEGDLPFIIMDDPFLALDRTHFEKTKTLLEKLAENKQMIYFCCHESRKI